MRILMVIPYFMPAISYGGPVQVAWEMARGLVVRGHEVTVATTDAFDAVSRIAKTTDVLDGVNVVRFRNVSNTFAKKYNAYLPLLFIPWFVKNCGRFDVVYCHDFFSLQAVVAGFVCKLRKIPFLLQPHGSLSAIRRSARFAGIKKAFTFFFCGILRNVHNIIALTRAEKESLAALVPAMAEKIVIVPNGLDPYEFADREKSDLHARYNIPGNHKIIGFIGRVAYIKGVDISLEVLATLKDGHGFTFLVIGPDEGELARLRLLGESLGMGDRLVFAGILGGEEKLRVMQSCDFFLFTSRDEGLPMALLEVAALGVPQVVSKECNVPELAEYQAGFVHACDDIAGLARSVETLLRDGAAGQAMGQNARLMVRERFSTDRMLAGIEQLLSASLHKKRSSH